MKEADILDYLKTLAWVNQLKRSFWLIMGGVALVIFSIAILISFQIVTLDVAIAFSAIISAFLSYWIGSQLWERVITPEIEDLARKKRMMRFKHGLLMEFK